MSSQPRNFGSEHYRGFLSRQGQSFYDQLNQQFLREDYSGQTRFRLSEPETAASDGFAAFKALKDDHPEYFFLGFQSEFTRCGTNGTLTYPILYSHDVIKRINQQLRKSIYRIVRGTAHLQVIKREILINERIAKKLSYTNNSDVRDHSIVGPVLLSSGVCEGHNALLMLCLRRIGIPCIKVYGKTEKDGWHCWTVAWVDGLPVHCDVTWDGASEGVVRFNYFNLTDKQIALDHYCFRSKRVPVCESEGMDYYSYYNLRVKSFNELRQRLRTESKRDLPIRIHFDYHPVCGDYFKEAQKAITAEQISGRHSLCFHPTTKNLIIKKM